jgi:3-oxoacyl-[acyl-carrier protein] reductase
LTDELRGKRALVTGGTRGIGAAVARLLADRGADVTVTGTSAGRTPPGANIRYELADFSDSHATERFASSMADRGIEILINNAGINVVAPFADVDVTDFDRILRVNVRAPMVLCRALLAGMRGRGWGRIVNVTSVFSHVSREGRAAYSTSKFGLDGMTAALAAEVARDGVLANCVAPGFVDTELTRRILGEAGMRDVAALVPIGRLATADEIARFIVWLAGPENTYISGQNLFIDGGFTRV